MVFNLSDMFVGALVFNPVTAPIFLPRIVSGGLKVGTDLAKAQSEHRRLAQENELLIDAIKGSAIVAVVGVSAFIIYKYYRGK